MSSDSPYTDPLRGNAKPAAGPPAVPSKPRWDIELRVTWGEFGFLLTALACLDLLIMLAAQYGAGDPSIAYNGIASGWSERAGPMLLHACACLMFALPPVGAITCLIGVFMNSGRVVGVLGFFPAFCLSWFVLLTLLHLH